MKKELTFIQQSECELTGQPSSKRINAYRAMYLVILIVVTLCGVIAYTACRGIDIKPNTLALCYFVGSAVLMPLLGFAGYIHTIAANQNKQTIDANLVTNVNNKVEDTTVTS